MDSDQLERLFRLKENGAITEKEFKIQKRKILKKDLASYSKRTGFIWLGGAVIILWLLCISAETPRITIDLQSEQEAYALTCHKNCQKKPLSQKQTCDCICLSLSHIMTVEDFEFIANNGEDNWKQLSDTQKMSESTKLKCSF